MDGGLQAALGGCLFWLTAPVFILVHELGHAAIALVRTDGRVEIDVGRPPARWRFRAGRLDVAVNPIMPLKGRSGGLMRASDRLGPYSQIALVLAGPTASAIFSAAVVYAGVSTHLTVITVAGAWGLFLSVFALVPRKTVRTDGANLVAALRGVRSNRASETLHTWAVLMKDVEGTLGPVRGHVLNGLPPALEHPGKGPDALAIWYMAFAGYCWRSAEGSSADLRNAALDELQDSTRSGAVEPQLTFGAAWMLAARESEVGLDRLPPGMMSSDVDEEKQRFAFRFGLALYDVEAARGSIA